MLSGLLFLVNYFSNKYMKSVNKNIYSGLILLIVFFFSINYCSAGFLKATVNEGVKEQAFSAGQQGGYNVFGSDMFTLIQTVINAFLSLIGVILLIYILYAGYNWMTAQGEEEKVTKAKETITRAIIGVIIIVAAYAISYFVMYKIETGNLQDASVSRVVPVIGLQKNA